eukprot:scaffold297970_cov66-Cyclotella_meneghiniana.AAC.2
MSSGYGRKGPAAPPVPSTNNRKRNKKYGLNLYQLQKGPAAPPVPSIITNASTKQTAPSNGLLLLSKKSSVAEAGLLAGKETQNYGNVKQTENDVLFAKAQGVAAANGQGNIAEDEGRKVAIPAAWGNKGEKQQTLPASADLSMEQLTLKPTSTTQPSDEESALKYDEKTSLLVLAPKGSLPKQKSNVSAPHESASITGNNDQQKDKQQQYMSKLAKERAQRLKSEDEARINQQKERAAKRLKELEAKRLEQKKEKERQQKQKQKKQPRFEGPPTSITIGKDAPKKPPTVVFSNVPSKIYSRKEVSKPSFVLEPLGKPKILTRTDDSSTNKSETNVAKTEEKQKLYDPNRPYSSLVGGKLKANEVKSTGSVKSGKSEESSRGKTNPPPVTAAPSNPDESVGPVQTVSLDGSSSRDRVVGRGTPSGAAGRGAGPRMLFDPTSGSLVAAQQQQQQQQQQQVSATGKPKQPIGPAKVTDAKQKQLQNPKKPESKSRKPPKKPRVKHPRTRGVKFRKDENGNYVNTDECEADRGYGQHCVPGGRIKNQAAYEKLAEHNDAMQNSTKSTNKLNADAPSFFGFQIQKDPTFLQQQNDFEVQQQKILEDAWASLEEGPSREDHSKETKVTNPPSFNSNDNQEDEYAAALAFSPSIIGLGAEKEEPFDVSKFALGDGSPGLPANRFSSLGGGGSRLLGSTAWATNTSTSTGASLGGVAGLSGWNFDPNASDFTPAGSTNINETERSSGNNTFINLNGWGSSGLDSFAYGGNNNNSNKSG